MAKSKIYVGLEVGTSKTCMVVGEVKTDGSVKILGVGETRSAGVRKGEITDMAQAKTGLKDALLKAEDICDVDISSVLLAVTGSHIKGANNRGTFRLRDDEEEIHLGHIEEATELGRDLAIPGDHVYLHNFISHYRLDGQEHSVSPIGLLGRTLDVDFHIVHGIRTRIQNCIKCVREIPLEVDDVVFAPIATAQVALDREDKDSGALVIDIGGGTTDYVLYLNGAIAASGCIPVGGDHITNDIHLVTHIPFSRAEELKKNEGDASGDPARGVGNVKVLDDQGYEEGEIKRSLLNDIIHGRLEETLHLILERLPNNALRNIGAGVYITGGTSRMRGFTDLAEKVFPGLPIYQAEQSNISGVHANFRDPQYTTAVGLIRYAQILDAERDAATGRGKIGKFFKSLWPFG
ncbi:cell division protein FtsA [Verrucomicrobiaceae bacterium N1E253]|uniref:Cell division protein FtsA n=1 Tax=Oceaniferula marina TaxID=2748318 RepID=A0A851GMX6_9BACT|nr:cell division protein FtsA [Oceaniferula marina]NWK56377.1 cell division protein FtsA [Oceaniferula marina]